MTEQIAHPDGEAVDPGQQLGASLAQRMLDGVERVGNKVPHPVMMFLYLNRFCNPDFHGA